MPLLLAQPELVRALQQVVDVVEQRPHVDAGRNVDRVDAGDLLHALVLRVGEPLLGVDAECREVELVLVLVFLLLLREALLVLLKDLVGNDVVLALVADEPLVACRDRPRREVLATPTCGQLKVERGQLGLAPALERS